MLLLGYRRKLQNVATTANSELHHSRTLRGSTGLLSLQCKRKSSKTADSSRVSLCVNGFVSTRRFGAAYCLYLQGLRGREHKYRCAALHVSPAINTTDTLRQFILNVPKNRISWRSVRRFRVACVQTDKATLILYIYIYIYIHTHTHTQSGPKKCIHSLLINMFGINLNEISISGWECNIKFSQQMAQALL